MIVSPIINYFYIHLGKQTTKGVCLAPKKLLDFKSSEVNRLYHLTANSIIPISYTIDKQNRLEIDKDLYPATKENYTNQTVAMWFKGINLAVPMSVPYKIENNRNEIIRILKRQIERLEQKTNIKIINDKLRKSKILSQR